MKPTIMICARKKENAEMMKAFLKSNGYSDITYASDVKRAQTMLSLKTYALILVDLPFTMDMHELSFLLSLSEVNEALIMAIVNVHQYENVRDKVEKFGIFTLMKPMQKEVLTQFLAISRTWYYRNHQNHQRQEQLVDKIKEIKLVDQAKCLLIENEFISEDEAHKRIEKAAMNERVTRIVIAQRIIKQYEE